MNPLIKAEWVKALKSGKYKQGRLALKREIDGEQGEFCCLGVLCDLYRKEKKKKLWSEIKYPFYTMYKMFEVGGLLPEKVSVWSGLYSSSPIAGGESLVDMNDHGISFEEIAKVIEENL